MHLIAPVSRPGGKWRSLKRPVDLLRTLVLLGSFWRQRGAMLALLFLAGFLAAATAHAQSPALGFALYKSVGQGGKGCITCHSQPGALSASAGPVGANPDNSGASNNPQRILDAIGGNVVEMAGLNVSAEEALSLALFIGQQKLPAITSALTMTVRSGASGTKNIYSQIQANGTGGAASTTGLTTVTPTTQGGTSSAAQVSVSPNIRYNITYQSTAQFKGTDTFDVNVRNANNGPATASMTVMCWASTTSSPRQWHARVKRIRWEVLCTRRSAAAARRTPSP